MAAFYGILRDMFGSVPAPPPQRPPGYVELAGAAASSVLGDQTGNYTIGSALQLHHGVVIVRTAIGNFLPQAWADCLFMLILLGITLWAFARLTKEAANLGCAFVKIGLLCVVVGVMFFSLLTYYEMSQKQFPSLREALVQSLFGALNPEELQQ